MVILNVKKICVNLFNPSNLRSIHSFLPYICQIKIRVYLRNPLNLRSNIMLKSYNLQYSYSANNPLEFPDIQANTGEHWLILGQSGCGKTTLLHLLAGLLTPKKGSVQIGDTDITKLSGARLDKFRGQNIGIVFQKPHFVKALSVRENLQMAQYLAGVTQDGQRIRTMLDRLNLAHKLKSRTDALSEGEKQRVAIARALLNRPAVILADEPTSALDDTNCEEVIQLLKNEAAEQQSTLFIVTHDQRLKDRFEHRIVL